MNFERVEIGYMIGCDAAVKENVSVFKLKEGIVEMVAGKVKCNVEFLEWVNALVC